MDEVMILISSKWFWIPLYIYITFLIYKNFKSDFYKILINNGFNFYRFFGSVHLFKEVFERERPCHVLEGVRVVDRCGGNYGFVSSHASNCFAITFFISLLFRS